MTDKPNAYTKDEAIEYIKMHLFHDLKKSNSNLTEYHFDDGRNFRNIFQAKNEEEAINFFLNGKFEQREELFYLTD